MRDIKFRAWDKKHKKMAQVYTLGLTGIEGSTICTDGELFSGCGSNNIDLMQYTGLKDKNGKEIYEGDIVKEEQYMSNDLISEVRFYEGRFDSLVRVKEGYNCIDQYSPESFEVIGNIHEHSHLLGVTKQP